MKFDTPVHVGEIRILADFPDPHLVLVLAEHGSFAYLVVPLSSCTAPASPREYELKGRVYQLWQTQTVSKTVITRSWLVERLAPEDFAEIKRAQSADHPAPLTSVERAQVVSFVAIADSLRAAESLRTAEPLRTAVRPRPRRCTESLITVIGRHLQNHTRLAASLLLVLGLATLVYNLYPSYTYTSKPTPNETSPILTVHLAKEPTPIDPLEEPTEVLTDESELALVPVEITLPALAFEVPSPEAAPQLSPLAEPIRLPGLPKIRGLAQAPAKTGVRKGTDPLKKGTGPSAFAAQRAETLDWLLRQQDIDGSWGQSLRGTSLAVIALLTDLQKGTGPAAEGTCPVRQTALVAGVRYLTEQMGIVPKHQKGTRAEADRLTQPKAVPDRQTAQLLACALSGGWVVTRNPNVKAAAERAIAAANSHLSVEAARDWTGLLVDLTPTVAEPKSGHFAAPRPEDELTAACLYLLQTVEAE